ncbi:MAG: VVA0879 family protein [Patescibacteria group bacterium]
MQAKMALAEWQEKGRQLFGKDFLKWRFACPCCGHVASVADFVGLGAAPECAYQECIGRHKGAGEMKPQGEGPCNYAAYGLFHLSPVVVQAGDHEVQAFGFAAPIEALATKCNLTGVKTRLACKHGDPACPKCVESGKTGFGFVEKITDH